MGADEYGFGSAAMIATGCVMARICHTNNCPVGVASQVIRFTTSSSSFAIFSHTLICWCFSISYYIFQKEELRAHFPGVRGDLVNFFLYVAEEVIYTPGSQRFDGFNASRVDSPAF